MWRPWEIGSGSTVGLHRARSRPNRCTSMAAIQKGRALQSRRRSGGQSKCWLAFGETDNGGPRLRKQYSPNYYAAFVLDSAGNSKGVYRCDKVASPGACAGPILVD